MTDDEFIRTLDGKGQDLVIHNHRTTRLLFLAADGFRRCAWEYRVAGNEAHRSACNDAAVTLEAGRKLPDTHRARDQAILATVRSLLVDGVPPTRLEDLRP